MPGPGDLYGLMSEVLEVVSDALCACSPAPTGGCSGSRNFDAWVSISEYDVTCCDPGALVVSLAGLQPSNPVQGPCGSPTQANFNIRFYRCSTPPDGQLCHPVDEMDGDARLLLSEAWIAWNALSCESCGGCLSDRIQLTGLTTLSECNDDFSSCCAGWQITASSIIPEFSCPPDCKGCGDPYDFPLVNKGCTGEPAKKLARPKVAL